MYKSAIVFILIVISGSLYAQDDYLILGSPSSQLSEKYILSGFIKSDEAKESLAGALVAVKDTKFSAVTNRYGKYSLKLPAGRYTLDISYLGHDSRTVKVELIGNATYHIEMTESGVSLKEFVIENSSYDRRFSEMLSGIEKLTIDDIKDLPNFMGEVDVIKSLQTLPGVSTTGEGATGFNVRGGRTDQNLILQDGGILFNAQHVLGFFSSFNPDAVNGFTLYKGNVPAYFGGRGSSVLDVNLRDGNPDKIQGRGGVGLVASRLTLDGPIIEGKTTFLLAGRASYADWILGRVKNLDIRQSDASFYDYNAKISHRFNNANKLDLSVYGSKDQFRFSDQFGFSWSNLLINATYNLIVSDRVLMTTNVIKGEYSSQLEDPSGIDAATVDNGIDYYQFKNLFLYEYNSKHLINAGIEGVFYDMKPEISQPIGEESGVMPEQ
ncbi:MAG: TonB-dependent receptor, partial [Cyclobacteriaceae bacterium]